MGSIGEKPLALGDPLLIVLQSFQFHPFVEVLPGNGRHAKEFRRRNGDIAVDPFGDLDQFLHVLLRKGVPEVVQGNEPMLHHHMVEECKEGLKEKFADNKGDAAGAKQDDARRFRFLCGHKYFILDSFI